MYYDTVKIYYRRPETEDYWELIILTENRIIKQVWVTHGKGWRVSNQNYHHNIDKYKNVHRISKQKAEEILFIDSI